jgi:hypothetical protein
MCNPGKHAGLHGSAVQNQNSRPANPGRYSGCPGPIYYTCDSGSTRHVTAIYYSETPLPVVILSGSESNDIWQESAYADKTQNPSIYRGRHVLLQVQEKGAILECDGMKTACTKPS